MLKSDKKKEYLKDINKIFESVIYNIDASRNQILDIVDDARQVYEKLKHDLEDINIQSNKAIDEVDMLISKDKLARNNLAKVSKNFKSNSEKDIKAAYEKATEIRILLVTAENTEKTIRDKRTTIEVAIKNALRNIKNAEQVVNQVTIVSSYLKGEILNAIEGSNTSVDMLMGVRILEAQENERTRISRDIHDGPAQRIANIVMKADLCEKIMKKDMASGLNELEGLKKASRDALKGVRDIIYNLRPMSLDDLGLNKTIEMNAKTTFEKSSNKIEYNLAKMSDKVEGIIQVAMFRIIQEILNNINKHAEASKVVITTDYGTKYLRITISDDGKGFDYNNTLIRVRREKKSYGLLGLGERISQLQGELTIDSEIGLGTIFNVKLPINREVILDE